MPSSGQLRTYSVDLIKPIDNLDGQLVYNNQNLNVSFIVADTKGPNLLRRGIMRLLKLNWEKLLDINTVREIVTTEEKLKKILSEYDELFKSDLTWLKGVEIELTVNLDYESKFCKARPIPYARKEQIEKELEQIIANDIYEPIQYFKQTTPMIPVLKDLWGLQASH